MKQLIYGCLVLLSFLTSVAVWAEDFSLWDKQPEKDAVHIREKLDANDMNPLRKPKS